MARRLFQNQHPLRPRRRPRPRLRLLLLRPPQSLLKWTYGCSFGLLPPQRLPQNLRPPPPLCVPPIFLTSSPSSKIRPSLRRNRPSSVIRIPHLSRNKVGCVRLRNKILEPRAPVVLGLPYILANKWLMAMVGLPMPTDPADHLRCRRGWVAHECRSTRIPGSRGCLLPKCHLRCRPRCSLRCGRAITLYVSKVALNF
jgi:hypothetical protein